MPTISLGRASGRSESLRPSLPQQELGGVEDVSAGAVCRASRSRTTSRSIARRTGRTAWPAAPFTEAAVIVGRRGGKSRILALIAVYLAAFRDYAPYLAPGEVATIGVLAVDKGQARAIFRFVHWAIEGGADAGAADRAARHRDDRAEQSGSYRDRHGVFRSTRGYSYAAVLCDEVAFWRQRRDVAQSRCRNSAGAAAWPGDDPGRDVVDRFVALIRSAASFTTPYRRHFGRDDARVLVWKASTAEMNPSIDKRIIDEAYEDDPESGQGGIRRRIPHRSGRLRLARDGRRGDHVGAPRAAARARRDLQRLRRSVGRRLGFDDAGDRPSRPQRRLHSRRG